MERGEVERAARIDEEMFVLDSFFFKIKTLLFLKWQTKPPKISKNCFEKRDCGLRAPIRASKCTATVKKYKGNNEVTSSVASILQASRIQVRVSKIPDHGVCNCF